MEGMPTRLIWTTAKRLPTLTRRSEWARSYCVQRAVQIHKATRERAAWTTYICLLRALAHLELHALLVRSAYAAIHARLLLLDFLQSSR